MQWIKATICDTCGVPTIWANWIFVDSDNTSIDTRAKMRGVFYEIEEVHYIFEKIEQIAAIPMWHLCFEAHKEAIRYFFEGAMAGTLGTVVRKAVPLLVLKRLSEAAPLFGVGTLKIVGFQRGESIKNISLNAWNERLLKGDIGGAFEALTQEECDVEGTWEGDKYIVVARRRDSIIEEFEGRFAPIESKSIGTRDRPKCRRCGAPASFQVFEWNRELGEIRERDTGLRVVYETPAAVDSLLQELEKEIGSVILDTVIRIEAEYVKERIAAGVYDGLLEKEAAADAMTEYINLITRRCFGNVTKCDFDGKELRVVIRNPGSKAMVIGRVLGSYEAVTGVKGKYATGQDDEKLTVAVTPRMDSLGA